MHTFGGFGSWDGNFDPKRVELAMSGEMLGKLVLFFAKQAKRANHGLL